MNAFDYLFSNSRQLEKDFVLGCKEGSSFTKVYKDCVQFADYLNEEIGENQKIILIATNSIFFITAYLAILKSGNICVPLSPSIEERNLDHILLITCCNCVVLDNNIVAGINFPELKRIRERDLSNILDNDKLGSRAANELFSEDRTALIMFTSGSTGEPKGVVITHKNIIANTGAIIEGLRLSSKDIMGVVLPFTYCYGLSLLHTHLKVGGSVVLINQFFFLGSVIKSLKEFRCTGFAGVPSHFQILIRKSQGFLNTAFPDLTYVTQAGGKLHEIFIEEFTKAFPSVNFFVMYGQTEATARLTILPPHLLKSKPGSVGKAISGVRLKIVDEHHQPVKPGEIGEILAKGNNIMKEYYSDTAATGNSLKDGWLLTGDLGRMDEDGFLYLISRKKEILKVGGRRISPKEIEEIILSLPEIVDCTVTGIQDEILGEAIKATVVLAGFCDDEASIKHKIIKVCQEKLASYKIPKEYQFETAINVNSAGKKIKALNTQN